MKKATVLVPLLVLGVVFLAGSRPRAGTSPGDPTMAAALRARGLELGYNLDHDHARVLALDPLRKDAGLIVGMYRYAVSALPVPLRLLAHLVGFGGDRARGLRLIEDAAAYPSGAQPNALFTLVLLYNREARYD